MADSTTSLGFQNAV